MISEDHLTNMVQGGLGDFVWISLPDKFRPLITPFSASTSQPGWKYCQFGSPLKRSLLLTDALHRQACL